MDFLKQLDGSHHATLVRGDFGTIRDELIRTISKRFSMEHEGNPDFQVRMYETLSIDEARELKDASKLRPMAWNKVFVIAFTSIGVEAQNALLKVFEEPTEGTHFFLVAPVSARLLPTLLSRLSVLHAAGSEKIGKEAAAFLKASGGVRFDLIKDIVEEKDRVRAGELLVDMERTLAKDVVANARALAEIERARGYLNDRASSVKLLLEHIALVLPQTA